MTRPNYRGAAMMHYIRTAYNVPAKRGMRVTIDGRDGTITGSYNAYLRVKFDGEKASRFCHPTWRVKYHAR